MTCGMQLAGMAPSRWLSPVVPFVCCSRSMAFGVSDREAEQFLAPTAGLLYLGVVIAGTRNLDMHKCCWTGEGVVVSAGTFAFLET